MNAVRHSTSSMLRLGALVVGFGVWLLVTNLVGLWLSRHVAILGSLVLGSWPMLLITGGLVLLALGIIRRPYAVSRREVNHER